VTAIAYACPLNELCAPTKSPWVETYETYGAWTNGRLSDFCLVTDPGQRG